MRITVSIVEDQARTRNAVRDLLDSHRAFRCVSDHATAEDAVREIPRVNPDVVLVDIVINGDSGIDCVRQLKKIRPDLPILMLTVYEDAERLFGSLAAGADGYILKRTEPRSILEAIRDVLGGGAPMSRTIARKVLQHFRNLSGPTSVPDPERLSDREREILQPLATGYTDKEIAKQLGISSDTVRSHLKRIYKKLHVSTRTAAAAKFRGD
jgi:DNA-binding NarL/FixJ family response regulator